MDKIGDLLLSLSVDECHAEMKDRTTWLVSSGLAPLMEMTQPSKFFLEFPKAFSVRNFFKLWAWLKKERFTHCVNLYSPIWVSWCCLLAGIPKRSGRWSKLSSYLTFNQGVRQRRSLAERHESQYSLELSQKLFPTNVYEPPALQLMPPNASRLLEKYQLQPEKYFIVHPGMAGSALNWPQENYNILIEKLVNLHPVIVTGTAEDEKFLGSIRSQWGSHSQVRWLQGQLQLKELTSLLSRARGVVAPSTGVLHLASAVGAKCVGIYCPIQANHPRRWGPRGRQSSVVLPKNPCPAQLECLREKCEFHPCMQSIKVNEVLHQLGL